MYDSTRVPHDPAALTYILGSFSLRSLPCCLELVVLTIIMEIGVATFLEGEVRTH